MGDDLAEGVAPLPGLSWWHQPMWMPTVAVFPLPAPFVWAGIIVGLGVVLVVCVLLVLRRELTREESRARETPGASGRHFKRISSLLRAIRTITGAIVNERDERRLLETACSSLVAARGYRMAWVGLVEEHTKRVTPVCQAGFEDGYLEQIEITWDDSPTGQGPTGQCIKTGEPVVMRDIESAPEFRPWRSQALQRGYRSSAALPLRFESRVLGALNVYSEVRDAFDIEEIGLLQEVADHLAYAMAAVRLRQELAAAHNKLEQMQAISLGVDRLPVGFITTDRDGLVTSINRKMFDFLGAFRTAEEVVGKVRLPQLAMFNAGPARPYVQKVLCDGEPVCFQMDLGTGDRRQRTLCCRGVPIFDEKHGLKESVWLVENGLGRPRAQEQ